MSVATSPIRYPDVASRVVMTRRAWWLVVLNFLVPGAPQVLAGSRRLGRFGLSATLGLWALAIVALLLWLFSRPAIFTIFSTPWTLLIVAAVLVFYAALWIVLTLDTLRLVRIVKTTPSARGWIAGVTTFVMIALSGTTAYGAYFATTASGVISSMFVTGPTEPPDENGRYNILLLGGDSGPDREGMRPDSMSVLSIDAGTGQAVTIGLPRDFEYFPFSAGSPLSEAYPEGYGAIDGCEVDVCQLNSVYTEVELKTPEMYPNAVSEGSEPGIEGMRDAAEGITGLDIQFYALIDMQGFEGLINALGGVDINVETRIPIGGDEDNNDVDGWIEPGQQHLDGYYALWYGRARYGVAGGDYERMARQRVLQEAILHQFTPTNVLSKFSEVASAGADTVKTDVPQLMLGHFVDLAMKAKELPMGHVALTPENGVDPADPDYDYIRQLVADAIAPIVEEPAE